MIFLIFIILFLIYKNSKLKKELLVCKEQKNKLSILIQNSPDLIWLKDIDGNYLLCNQRVQNHFGTTNEEIIGKSDYDFFDKDLADFYKDNDHLALSSDEYVISFEDMLFKSDNHSEFLQTIRTVLKDDKGKVIGVLGISRDLSKIKNQEICFVDNKGENQCQ